MSKKKVILSSIALLLVMFVAVSVVSYSIANKGHGDRIEQSSLTNLGAEAGTDYVTNIDLIIENAVNNGETFNIVEVIPTGVTPSDLSTYVGNNGFGDYVISANKSTVEEDMPDGMVSYKSVNVGSATTLADVVDAGTGATIQEVFDSADLIYLSSPAYNSYNGTNNMSEEIFNYLHVYALGSNKPIIMDYVTSSTTTSAATTMGGLVNAISRNHIKFRTYSWTNGLSVEDFFTANNGSYYLKFNANSQKATGNVLVLANTATPGAGSMMNAMQTAGDSAIIKNAYYGLTANIPKELNYTVKNIGATALTEADLEGEYDFILIEDGVKDIVISDAVYKKLRALSESSKYILYNSNLVTTTSGTVNASANNYLKLMQLLISEKGVEMKTNVLAISYGFFTSLNEQGADGVEGAKAIANLINGTVYRDSATTGAAGKKFRVLEIQPCYPIDLDLAKTLESTSKYDAGQTGIKGGYYTYPDQVLYGVTKDEIEAGTEYYAFQMSKAKIAYATGIPYSQIEVVSVSANELISRKEVVSEAYDLVYIGGDASALMPYSLINYVGSDYNWQDNLVARFTSGFTAFDMYTHTGHFVDYIETDGWKLDTNRIGSDPNSITYNGYDLSTTKRDELKDYVDSGLPIIVDNVVAEAFLKSYQYDADNKNATDVNRLEQLKLHDIDPDCNMYQFLAYAYESLQSGTATNVGWGTVDSTKYDPTKTYDDVVIDQDDATDGEFYEGYTIHEKKVENIDRAYGNTLGTNVTVYRNSVNTDIKTLVDTCRKRPQLALTQYPKQYQEGNENSVNYGTEVAFKASVKNQSTDTTSQSYTVYLIVDANGDGVYSEGEIKAKQVCSDGATVDLSYSVEKDFIGLVNWKVLAVSADGKSCDMQMGNSLFKADPELKRSIRILQIMPVDDPSPDVFYSSQDKHSLYFCTECQEATKVINNNITIDANTFNQQFQKAFTDNAQVFSGKVTVGKHEHDFGIPIYDSTTDLDDWEANFADTLTHGDNPETVEVESSLEYGDYEFELDILNIGQFEELCSAALSRKDDEIEAAAQMAEDYLIDYEEGLNAANLKQLGNVLESEIYKAVESLNNGGEFRTAIVEGVGTADAPGQWMRDREYYKFWQYFNDGTGFQVHNISNFDTLAAAYNAYIEEYDKVIDNYNLYRTNSRQAGDSTTWMSNNYDVVILGLANEFGNKDLSVAACNQIQTYAESGGSVINSHDTLNAKSNGAKVMTAELRELFGMDRFHVVGVKNESTEVAVKSPTHTTKTIEIGYTWQTTGNFVIDKRDVIVELDGSNRIISVTETGEEKALGELITIIIHGGDQWNPPHYREQGSQAWTAISRDASLKGSFMVEQGATYVSSTFDIGTANVTGTFDMATGALTTQSVDTEVSEDGLKVDITVTDNGAVVPDGTTIVFSFRGTDTTVTTVNGIASTYVDVNAVGDPLVVPTGVKYRQYITKDSSKYFWTERLQAASEADYASVIATYDLGGYVKYNAPVGITDLFAAGDSTSKPLSPFRYAIVSPERFHQNDLETDLWNYKPHYGARRATKINTGGVTMYPFAISDTLIISPTHAQTFSLDLEDPSVAVWYSLSGTVVNTTPKPGETAVSPLDARIVSSFYAASPRDGMNNYFLYSKDNVFYTGAGHMQVTGRLKDNNDERRLFINVIVNCATRGVSNPDLKLYNKCDEEGSKHENCDCLYVDPDNDEDNDKLAKELNTLYYNKGIEMYQYNIDENQTDIYPEFDFKAIAGTANIKEIDVFYDLNYGEGDGMDFSDVYTDDDNHVLITSYDKSDDMNGVRARLREDIQKQKLLLKDEYFKNYKDCTYIVIRVKDEKNKWKSARVKINIIPHLFDLTDATSGYEKLPQDAVGIDRFDKKQFHI